MTDDATLSTSAAYAVFYNMTGEDVTMEVNGQVTTAEVVPAIPTASPYTPNHNTNSYVRVNLSEPQKYQFGNTNELTYTSGDGTSIDMTVRIDVDCDFYPVIYPLLVFLFRDAVVVTCPTDSVPYLGHDKDEIDVRPGSSTKL